MEEQIFILHNAEGEEQRCRMIFNFETDEHSYVLFTLIDDEGHAISDVTALRYETDENGEMADFSDLETEEEWAMVEEVLNTIFAEFGADNTNFFTVSDEAGNDVYCQILHKFEYNGAQYLFYGYADEEETQEVFASKYVADENGAVADLLPIETDEEWAMVEAKLNELASRDMN